MVQSLTAEPHSSCFSVHLHFNIESIGTGSLNEWNHVGYPAASVYLNLVVLPLPLPITLCLYLASTFLFITALFFSFSLTPPFPIARVPSLQVSSIFRPIFDRIKLTLVPFFPLLAYIGLDSAPFDSPPFFVPLSPKINVAPNSHSRAVINFREVNPGLNIQLQSGIKQICCSFNKIWGK